MTLKQKENYKWIHKQKKIAYNKSTHLWISCCYGNYSYCCCAWPHHAHSVKIAGWIRAINERIMRQRRPSWQLTRHIYNSQLYPQPTGRIHTTYNGRDCIQRSISPLAVLVALSYRLPRFAVGSARGLSWLVRDAWKKTSGRTKSDYDSKCFSFVFFADLSVNLTRRCSK